VKGLEPQAPRPLGAGLRERGSVELWAARERFQPLPYPALTRRPLLTRSGIVGGVEKRNRTTPGLGRRVWKIRVNRVNREILKAMYEDVIHKRSGSIPKGLLYYADEWREMYENAKRMRERGWQEDAAEDAAATPAREVRDAGRAGARQKGRCLYYRLEEGRASDPELRNCAEAAEEPREGAG